MNGTSLWTPRNNLHNWNCKTTFIEEHWLFKIVVKNESKLTNINKSIFFFNFTTLYIYYFKKSSYSSILGGLLPESMVTTIYKPKKYIYVCYHEKIILSNERKKQQSKVVLEVAELDDWTLVSQVLLYALYSSP